jgi:hypothetical protein
VLLSRPIKIKAKEHPVPVAQLFRPLLPFSGRNNPKTNCFLPIIPEKQHSKVRIEYCTLQQLRKNKHARK